VSATLTNILIRRSKWFGGLTRLHEITPRVFGAIAASLRRVSVPFQFQSQKMLISAHAALAGRSGE